MHKLGLNVALLLKICKSFLLTSTINFNECFVFNYVFHSFVNMDKDICLSTNYHELTQVHKQRNNEANLLNAKEHKLNPIMKRYSFDRFNSRLTTLPSTDSPSF